MARFKMAKTGSRSKMRRVKAPKPVALRSLAHHYLQSLPCPGGTRQEETQPLKASLGPPRQTLQPAPTAVHWATPGWTLARATYRRDHPQVYLLGLTFRFRIIRSAGTEGSRGMIGLERPVIHAM